MVFGVSWGHHFIFRHSGGIMRLSGSLGRVCWMRTSLGV